MGGRILPEHFFARDTVEVAQDLLGQDLLRRTTRGELRARIVEVEAYLDEDDPASHAAAGKNSRARIFWGPPGRAYVFLIYGLHHCLNIVTRPKGQAGCVLIRAVEPLKGLDLMRQYRPNQINKNLTNGPAKLCQALNIDRAQNGMNVTLPQSELQVIMGLVPNFKMEITPRIGIGKAKDKMLRFAISGNPYVSKKQKNRQIQ
jgi:DNA-3-methyladenine glycosylase